MASSSGITSSLSNWIDHLNDKSIRIIKIVIESEKLEIATEVKSVGSFEEDYNLLPSFIIDSTPAYILYRIDDTSFIFYSYVSDSSPVRQKMLYASTRGDLLRTLNDSSFEFKPIFASTLDDLTYKSYVAHLAHLSSEAPLSIREKEMLEIKNNELREQQSDTRGVGRSIISGLEWSDEANLLAEEFHKGEKEIIRLEIDTVSETIIVASEQPTALALPSSSPAYTFYRYSGRVVFIYSCPPTSPIKSRLLYSSSANGVSLTAKSLSIVVAKKIESSSPEEIDDAYVLEELGPAPPLLNTKGSTEAVLEGTIATAPLPASDEKTFSKPSRPGRKR